jgi:hypothetical protein
MTTVLVACSSTESKQDKYFNVRTADFSTTSNDRLCSVYGYRLNRSSEAKIELMKRQVFSEAEWKNIDEHKVTVGMSKCAMKAAYSLDYKEVINTKYNDGRHVRSYVYKCEPLKLPYCPYTKVDVSNGKIISIMKHDAINEVNRQ